MDKFVRSAYNYDSDLVSAQTATLNEDADMAVQSEKDSCDINVIVRRFGVTGQLPQNVAVPRYEDFDSVFDFRTAMNAVVAAKESFGELAAEVRERFSNDPQRFLEFCSDPSNVDEMIKFGLAVKRDVVPDPKIDDGQVPPTV